MHGEKAGQGWSEKDWCNALDGVLEKLGIYFSRDEPRSMALLLLVEGGHEKPADPDLSVLWEKYTLFRLGGGWDGLYRVNRYDRLSDTPSSAAVFGWATLIGVAEHAVQRLHEATENGSLTVFRSANRLSDLGHVLDPHAPYFFGLTAYTDGCPFSATHSRECPVEIRNILDEALQAPRCT